MCIPFLLFYVCFSCFHFFGDSFTNRCQRAVTFVCNLMWHSSFTVCTSERVTMELADRTIGLLLTVTSLSIFTYYTFWVIILVSSFFLSVLQDVVTFKTFCYHMGVDICFLSFSHWLILIILCTNIFYLKSMQFLFPYLLE